MNNIIISKEAVFLSLSFKNNWAYSSSTVNLAFKHPNVTDLAIEMLHLAVLGKMLTVYLNFLVMANPLKSGAA